ncbi:MAG: aspartate--tRNA ligase [Patescibacteria group bacterium]
MKRMWIEEVAEKDGEEIKVSGWVHSRRDHGKIVFLDLRDRTGLLQVVFVPGTDAYEKVNNVRPEWVISVVGKVKPRPEKLVNPNIISGKVELEAKELEVLNKAKSSPFEIDKTTAGIDEELRLKYRYLDLRTERMMNNIKLRNSVAQFIRRYLLDKKFYEIETPYLTKSTPEGAREYIVPSRLYPGEFYVLPQSPQQFKQLLMIGGMERYFQIVRCFRDEDTRGDRQPEFTQVDIEMSFVEREDVLGLVEKMMIELVQEVLPEHTITKTPFPRITFAESMAKYGTDKPDLRQDKNNPKELAFSWIVDVPLFKYSETEKKLVSSHHPFTMPHVEDVNKLETDPKNVRSYAYDLALNGFEVLGGSIRIHDREIQNKIFDLLSVSEAEKARRFGHMLEAFEYGAPPHGGGAIGFDRLMAVLAGEEAIREVIAFPKTGDGRDLMMGAPSPVSERQLKDVHIRLAKEAEGKALAEAETQMTD